MRNHLTAYFFFIADVEGVSVVQSSQFMRKPIRQLRPKDEEEGISPQRDTNRMEKKLNESETTHKRDRKDRTGREKTERWVDRIVVIISLHFNRQVI